MPVLQVIFASKEAVKPWNADSLQDAWTDARPKVNPTHPIQLANSQAGGVLSMQVYPFT